METGLSLLFLKITWHIIPCFQRLCEIVHGISITSSTPHVAQPLCTLNFHPNIVSDKAQIRITKETRAKLKQIGTMDEYYDDVISRLITSFLDKQTTATNTLTLLRNEEFGSLCGGCPYPDIVEPLILGDKANSLHTPLLGR